MKTKKSVPFSKILKEDLKNPKIKKAYGEEEFFSGVALSIVKLRKESNVTQYKLADLLHTSQQTISNIEHARHNLTIRTIFKIAKALNRKPLLRFV